MGKLIALDGLDGSGKFTQATMLYNRLKADGKRVNLISFPDYPSASSALVREYLDGNIGSNPEELNAYLCSLFYTADRGIQFVKRFNDMYKEEDSVIICDRYISSNAIHQGSKLASRQEKEEYFDWLYDTEVNKIGLPEEDLVLILSLPVDVSEKLIEKRGDSTGRSKDIHEANIAYMRKCRDTMCIATDYFISKGKNWVELNCATADGMDIQPADMIGNKVYELVCNII